MDAVQVLPPRSVGVPGEDRDDTRGDEVEGVEETFDLGLGAPGEHHSGTGCGAHVAVHGERVEVGPGVGEGETAA
jgi:hypothetical protein